MLGVKWDQLAQDDGLALEIARLWQAEKRKAPTLHRAPVGTGSAVLADPHLVKGVIRQQRKTLGIEMEIYGVYYAVEVASRPRPLVCAFKGVCDFADAHKEDSAQPFAAYASASFTRAFFEKYMAELC
jgi:nucleoside phosphorylase